MVSLSEVEILALADLLRLEDRREYDETRIAAYLGDPSREVRRSAARAAGRIRDPRAVGPLIQALADSSGSVRAETAFALGQLGDSSAHVVSALADLGLDPTEALAARVEAVAALGKLRSEQARGILETILGNEATGNGNYPDPVIEEALLAIWKFPRVDGMTEPIAKLAESPASEKRWRAVYALMRLADPAMITTLLERRHDSDPLVRALTMRGLQPGVADSAGRRADAGAALAEATRDPHPHVRINALRALGNYRTPEYSSTLAIGLRDEDTNVRVAAAEALTELGGDEATMALEALANDSTTRLALRATALTGLLHLAPERGLLIADTLARSEEWLTRLYTARALSALPMELRIDPLTRLVYDTDPRIVAAALSGLATPEPELAPGLMRIFIEQLGSSDTGVREAALRGLGAHAGATELPLLLDAYERAQHDDGVNTAARAAVAALGLLAERGVPVQRAFFRRFSRATDPIVLREVAEALGPGEWGDIFPLVPEHTADYYEEVVRTLVAPDLAGAPRPRAIIHTATGTITLELAAADAPLTVHNLMTLANEGYFTGFRWHRVVPNFVLQDGDPRGDGLGGPGYTIRDEFNRLRYLRGTLGMALDGADTGGSQFFITHAPQPHLDGAYTVFGQVIAGLDVADRVAQDDPIHRIEIVPAIAAAPPFGMVGR
jgi:cyclophilin family peptidyl-prolyl cis-trans isomerase/HEAT repeat protein